MNNRNRLALVEDGFVYNNGGRRPIEDYLDDIELCLTHDKFVNDWERNFLFECLGFALISPRQAEKLRLVVRKVRIGIDLAKRRQRETAR